VKTSLKQWRILRVADEVIESLLINKSVQIFGAKISYRGNNIFEVGD
jgi:hypothetical protein